VRERSAADVQRVRAVNELDKSGRLAQGKEVLRRLTAARDMATRSAETREHFLYTALHAPSAIERVQGAILAAEWSRQAEVDKATVGGLEAELAEFEGVRASA
jgi:hypothetical protein